MENLIINLQNDIKKIVGSLLPEEQLIEVLKKRLTKKEFKYYKLRCKNSSKEVFLQELRCDENRLEALEKQTLLKLNQEKIKKDLVEY